MKTTGMLVSLFMLAMVVTGQEKPALGFFQDEAPGMEVKTFALPLEGGKGSVNAYVAWDPGSKTAVVIDPGVAGPEIPAFIDTRGLKLTAVLLTHGHEDHVGGAAALERKYSIPIYLHRDDHALAARNTQPGTRFTDYPRTKVLRLGNLEFTVIPTPGHTPGSVCLYCGESLFSGDTLFAGTIGRGAGTDPGRREASLRQEVDSIRRLLFALPAMTRVFPGHGRATTIGSEKVFNPYLQ